MSSDRPQLFEIAMRQLAVKAADPLSPNLSRRRPRDLHGHQRRRRGYEP